MNQAPLQIVALGRGKTGSLVIEVARERGHRVHMLAASDNANGAWLTADNLRHADVVIDFTSPHGVQANIEAVVNAGKAMVVGTTGWYEQLDRVKKLVEDRGTGFVFGANFSYGVNLLFQIVKVAAPALTHGYIGHITETHHIHKKDAPSGTAVALQKILNQAADIEVPITSEREGDVTGAHTLELSATGDRIMLTHEAKSRRTFAEGAVLAAEWIVHKRGFYDFKDIFSQL